MPFNPDEYLAKKETANPVGGTEKSFDPNAYLAAKGLDTKGFELVSSPEQKQQSFDPNEYELVHSPVAETKLQAEGNSDYTPGGVVKTGSVTQDRGMAFAQSMLDMAMPLTRQAEAMGLRIQNPGMGYGQSMDQANQQAEGLKNRFPTESVVGAGLGLGAGGLLGGLANEAAMPAASLFRKGLAKVTAEETANAISRGIVEIGGLAFEGGAMSVLQDDPRSFKEALSSFSRGATIAGALGLTVKGLAAGAGKAGNTLESLDESLTSYAKKKQAGEIIQAEKAASIKAGQVNRQEELLSRNQSELELTKSHLDRTKALVSQEPFINDRVSNLPQKIDGLLDQHLNEIGSKKSSIVKSISEQRVDPTPVFKKHLDQLNSINPKTLTPQAESARQQAIAYIEQLDQRMFDSLSPTDSLIGIKQARNTNIGSLDQIHDQVQSLIFDRGFLQNAPRGTSINKITSSFERDLRGMINKADPTGELAVYNEAYHNLKVAKEQDALSLDNPRFFMQKATDPNNPALLSRYKTFEANITPESQGGNFRAPKEFEVDPIVSPALKEKNSSEFADKLATAVFDKRLTKAREQASSANRAYDDVNKRFQAIKDTIQAEAEPAMNDYAVLQAAKPKLETLENRILALENSAESRTASLESRKLSKENADIAVQAKKDEIPQNSLEALLPAKLRAALNIKRKIADNQAMVDQVKQGFLQKTIDTGRIGLDAFSRGAATRLPSVLGLTKPEGSLNSLTPDNSTIQPSSLKVIK